MPQHKGFDEKNGDRPSEWRHIVIWILLVPLVFIITNTISDAQASRPKIVSGMAPAVTILPATPSATAQPTATLPQPTPTKTPLPAQYLENFDDTNGVVVGTVMLVIIILLGTISGIRVRRSQD